MEVSLVHHTPLKVAVLGALVCTANEKKIGEYLGESEDTLSSKGIKFMCALVDKGHHSVLEHVNYTFLVSGISRGLLQELARHRHISLSVQSTRWTLRKIREDLKTINPEELLDKDGYFSAEAYDGLEDEAKSVLVRLLIQRQRLMEEVAEASRVLPNDIVKYFIPESLETKLLISLNLREFRHIYSLRRSDPALKEFQKLVHKMVVALPGTHRPWVIRNGGE